MCQRYFRENSVERKLCELASRCNFRCCHTIRSQETSNVSKHSKMFTVGKSLRFLQKENEQKLNVPWCFKSLIISLKSQRGRAYFKGVRPGLTTASGGRSQRSALLWLPCENPFILPVLWFLTLPARENNQRSFLLQTCVLSWRVWFHVSHWSVPPPLPLPTGLLTCRQGLCSWANSP